MDLFTDQIDPSKNWLPMDGVVQYFGAIMPKEEADQYYQILLENIPWEQDVVHMFGKRIVTKRKVAWYGDKLLITPIPIAPKRLCLGLQRYKNSKISPKP